MDEYECEGALLDVAHKEGYTVVTKSRKEQQEGQRARKRDGKDMCNSQQFRHTSFI